MIELLSIPPSDPSSSCPHGGGAGHLCIQAFVQHPTGWIALNDWTTTRLAGDSLGSQDVRHRVQKVTSPYIEGQFTVTALRDEVGESLSVWVKAPTLSELRSDLATIAEALDQPSYKVALWMGDHWAVWFASAADYRIEMSPPMLHERMAKLTATINRYPVVYAEIT